MIVGSIEEAELRAFLGANSLDCWRTGNGGWQFPVSAPGQPGELTLVVTEGFGVHPMSLPLFELLALHDRQEALIEGQTRLRGPMRRPRVVIPLSSRTAGVQLEPPRPTLRAGSTVRILHGAQLGQTGQVRSVTNVPRRLPSRVRVPSVEVVLEDSTTLTLPRTDVETLS